MKKCSSCKNNKNNNNNSNNNNNTNKKFSKKQRQPHFGNNHNTIFPNNKVPDLNGVKLSNPKNCNQEMVLDLGKVYANRYVLYYGSTKKDLSQYNHVKNSNQAYNDFRNNGIAKLDAKGKSQVKFRCPQVYKEGGKTVLPHIHYIVAKKGNKEWNNKLKVKEVVCEVNYVELKDMIKNRCALILNALPIEYYIMDRIPMSVPLPHDLVMKKLNAKQVLKYIKEVLPHASKIHKAVISGKMDLMDIPIVSYCYDEGCAADRDLQEKMVKIGFKNVKLYSPGIKGWLKKK